MVLSLRDRGTAAEGASLAQPGVAASLRVVLISHTSLAQNSGIQLFYLARAMTELGHECVVVAPDGTAGTEGLPASDFAVLSYQAARSGAWPFGDQRGPDLIYAWSPREAVQVLTAQLVECFGCPYVVHLEDNDQFIAERRRDRPVGAGRPLPGLRGGERQLRGWLEQRRARAFIDRARGYTLIIDKLAELVPSRRPQVTFWPSCPPAMFYRQPPDMALRHSLGLADQDIVITYNGNVHDANAGDMRSLYLAILFLNRIGFPARLLRLGDDTVDLLGSLSPLVAPFVINVGRCRYDEIPRHLALARVLVQPGEPGAFNDYRIPSKLPEFLAMGRPVVMPATGLARWMTDGEDCLMLRTGSVEEIGRSVSRILLEPDLEARLATNGRRFYDRHLSWSHAASKVLALFQKLVSPAAPTTAVTAGRSPVAAGLGTSRAWRPRPAFNGKLAFVHIPKTAGTALKQAIARDIPDGELFKVWSPRFGGDAEWNEFPAVPREEVLSRRAILGHATGRAMVDKLAGVRERYFLFSVVRDPLERALSLYSFVRASPRHPDHQAFLDMSPEHYLESYYSPNQLCWWLSSSSSAGEAMGFITANFDAVVTVDQLDQLLRLIADLGHPVGPLKQANVTRQRLRAEALDPAVLRRFEDRNLDDRALFASLQREPMIL